MQSTGVLRIDFDKMFNDRALVFLYPFTPLGKCQKMPGEVKKSSLTQVKANFKNLAMFRVCVSLNAQHFLLSPPIPHFSVACCLFFFSLTRNNLIQ